MIAFLVVVIVQVAFSTAMTPDQIVAYTCSDGFTQNICCGDERGCIFTRKIDLQNAAIDYVSDISKGILAYGKMNCWDTSKITDMNFLFCGYYDCPRIFDTFNEKISCWNVSQVTDMESMFGMASAFNQDLSNWNVVNVKDMTAMFEGALNFNQNLCPWYTVMTTTPDLYSGMFVESGCVNQADPDLISKSSFCAECDPFLNA